MENRYTDSDLTKDIISSGRHRAFIGGKWDEIGLLQFEYLKQKGLETSHRLLDVGCGCLRGGVHFIPYLEPKHYYGFDLNMSLIQVGLDVEIANLGFLHKIDMRNFGSAEGFAYPSDWPEMDMAIAVSLLTHLNFASVCKCLKKTRQFLKKEGLFFATIFEVSEEEYNEPFEQCLNIKTHPFKDPYHYTRAQIEQAGLDSGLKLNDIEDFGHPRNQKMAIFERI